MAGATLAPNKSRSIITPQFIMILLLLLVFAGGVYDGKFAQIAISAIADAYIQVTSFVAATLFLFYGIERLFKVDLTRKLAEAGKLQVLFAAILGALPGCGGAIIVVTRYVSGSLSFGSVLATLTATMGDAAFLLLAKEPKVGLFVLASGLIIGVGTGYLVDFIHGPDFLRPKTKPKDFKDPPIIPEHWDNPVLNKLWIALIIPGIILGILAAFQVDLDRLFANNFIPQPATYFGFFAGCFCLFMWGAPQILKGFNQSNQKIPRFLRETISDTNFVTSWVIVAFLLFEIWLYYFNIELDKIFDGFVLFTPLLAVLIGFLPGCGPQIIITSMYLAGIIPLSAQLGNAISNDGDALFPAIALAPKTAIVATLYSSIPALIIAYGWYFFME